jgi:methionyl-tRNA formyltransferase
LLPQYRGAAPINWVIINGEKKTGITTFFIDHEIDTGDLLFQEEVSIADHENSGSLHDKLMIAGAALVLKTVRAIDANQISPISQKAAEVIQHAPKIFKEDCKIDWNKEVRQIYNTIRGLSPYPAAYTLIGEKMLKIYESTYTVGIPTQSAGTYTSDDKTYLRFFAINGWIDVTVLQLEGKRKMEIGDFLRGRNLES